MAEWKPVPDWENCYEVSENGDVRSVPRCIKRSDGSIQNWPQRMLSPTLGSTGYFLVRLSNVTSGQRAQVKIHRLVAAAFLARPTGASEVNHIDGDKRNNRVSNLEWCTTKHNARHAAQMRLNPIAKLSDEQVLEARARYQAGWSVRGLAKSFGLDKRAMGFLLRGETYRWVPSPPQRSSNRKDGGGA